MLLPFGEEGHTNVGKITASKGTLTLPDAATLVANMEHDSTKPVAKFISLTESDDGLRASLRILNTTSGNDLLIEASEGVRTGISVEIDDPIIRAGALIGGALSGAGFVTNPAFKSAQLVAADAGDIPADAAQSVIDALTKALKDLTEAVVPTDPTTDPVVDPNAATAEKETNMIPVTASAPQGLQAANVPEIASDLSANAIFTMLATANATGNRKMLAALADIVPANVVEMTQPQFVGELWSGKAFQRKIVPLFNHADLSSLTVQGWRWVTKPTVAAYAGNKTAVPSNIVDTEPVPLTASRIAGAHDIDRKFRDFNDTGFWEAYYRAMTESYAKVSDTAVLGNVITAAGAAVAGAVVPAGVSKGMAQIVDGAIRVLGATDTAPTFALVALNLYRDILLTRSDDTLTYLNAALGLEDGTINSFRVQPSAALAANQVLVGTKDSVTVHELGGDAPIRIEAENIALGGIDAGVFGYYAVNIHDASGLALVGPNVP